MQKPEASMKPFRRWFHCRVVCVSTALLAGSFVHGQSASYSNRTHAIRQSDSRAEQEAESMVSLPAEKIIGLLQQEPGLFLQVKKMLVRKAYEQGRLLDPEELSDDVLFRLITRDEKIRILVTHEIVERNYIRAKPNRDELEQEQQQQSDLASAQAEQADLKNGMNQEQAYWSSRVAQAQRLQTQQQLPGGYSPPSGSQPATPAPTTDPRRQVMQAQAKQ